MSRLWGDAKLGRGGTTPGRRARRRLPSATLAAYVDGALPPAEAARIERMLATFDEDRREVEALRRVRDALAAPTPEWEGVDLVARIQAAAVVAPAHKVRSSGPARATWSLASLGIAFAVVGAVALLVWSPAQLLPRPTDERSSHGEGDPVAKAAGPREADRGGRWAGIHVYHQAPQAGMAPVPLGIAVSAGQGLLFTYTNLGPRPFPYLMIFARDAAGEVWWFYPVYESARSDPSSIPIQSAAADVALGEFVRQPLHRGALEIDALFSRRPLRVSEIEAWLAADPHGSPPWQDAYLERVTTQVDADSREDR